MKIRKEKTGLHYFDRETGLHILFDEIKIDKTQVSNLPRTVSIALTNRCNLNCYYCYAEKNSNSIPIESLKSLLLNIDKLGTLEVTFGGGEPFMYSNINELLKWIWENTNLGVNITTNGHLLTKETVDSIARFVSSLRFSIDGDNNKYHSIKGKKLDDLIDTINYVKNKIPFGINAIINPNKVSDLNAVFEIALKLGAMDILLIPEHKNGEFLLSQIDWEEIVKLTEKYEKQIQINITYDASKHLSLNYLPTETTDEFLFAHISSDMKLKTHSYKKNGVYIKNINDIEGYFSQIKQEIL